MAGIRGKKKSSAAKALSGLRGVNRLLQQFYQVLTAPQEKADFAIATSPPRYSAVLKMPSRLQMAKLVMLLPISSHDPSSVTRKKKLSAR